MDFLEDFFRIFMAITTVLMYLAAGLFIIIQSIRRQATIIFENS